MERFRHDEFGGSNSTAATGQPLEYKLELKHRSNILEI